MTIPDGHLDNPDDTSRALSVSNEAAASPAPFSTATESPDGVKGLSHEYFDAKRRQAEEADAQRKRDLSELESNRQQLLDDFANYDSAHARRLSGSIALLVVLLVVEVVVAGPLFLLFIRANEALGAGAFVAGLQTISPFGSIGLLWLITLAVAAALIVTPRAFQYRAGAAPEDRLKVLDDKIETIRTDTPVHRREYLDEESRRLTTVIARVFLENPQRSELANKWRSQAEDILRQLEVADDKKRSTDSGGDARAPAPGEPIDKLPTLSDAQSLITQISELVLREERELHEQQSWRNLSVAIMVVYIAILVGVIAIALSAPFDYGTVIIPILGIPISVVWWGTMGSLAAILYKFYTERQRVRFDLEVRWLIARPIIGIIMGGVAYLALFGGLVLLNTGTAGQAPSLRLEVYLLVAFLAGFSDKFYHRIIDLLVEKTVGDEKKVEPPKTGAGPDTPVEPAPLKQPAA